MSLSVHKLRPARTICFVAVIATAVAGCSGTKTSDQAWTDFKADCRHMAVDDEGVRACLADRFTTYQEDSRQRATWFREVAGNVVGTVFGKAFEVGGQMALSEYEARLARRDAKALREAEAALHQIGAPDEE